MIPKPLLDELSRWIREKRYGNIQINFSAGKIVNVNRSESIKVEDLNSTFPIETRVEFIAITSMPLDK